MNAQHLGKRIARLAKYFFASFFLIGASTSSFAVEGYLSDINGKPIKNSTGQCWRTGTWTPALAVEECDPDIVKSRTPPSITKREDTPPIAAAPIEPKPETPAAIPQRVLLSTEVNFDFDKATLKPGEREKIDRLINQLNENNLDAGVAVAIEGYTDPIGTNQYNLNLARNRAAAVKRYLMDMGVAENKIIIIPRGETELIVQPEECRGSGSARNYIQCLQPDRRAEVQLVTTQTNREDRISSSAPDFIRSSF